MENSTTELLDAGDLARIIGYTKRTIWEKLKKNPEELPPTVFFSERSRFLRWHPEVVEKWLRQRSGLFVDDSVQVKSKKVGRPRKEGGMR